MHFLRRLSSSIILSCAESLLPLGEVVLGASLRGARKFGVRSAMSSVIAKRLCSELIFVRHNFARYSEISSTVFKILNEYSDLLEPLSIDEAFLDVTNDKKNIRSGTIIAEKIRSKIKTVTGLTASAGISYNKFLAKIASDINKPNGLFVIKPDDAQEFVTNLPVEKFFDIWEVTALKMHKLGIHIGLDLRQWSVDSLIRNFGKAGKFFYDIAREIDNRPVASSMSENLSERSLLMRKT